MCSFELALMRFLWVHWAANYLDVSVCVQFKDV